jgi:hypothetical protein
MIRRPTLAVALALGFLAVPLAAEAQQAPKVARIGYLAGQPGRYSPPARGLPSSTA